MPRKTRRRTDTIGHAIDLHVGRRVRERRILLGLSLPYLADRLGVSPQQAAKYETGVNRLTAGQLYVVAEALQIEPGHFFEGLGRGAGEMPVGPGPQRALTVLARDFVRLPPQARAAIHALARALADRELGGPEADGGETAAILQGTAAIAPSPETGFLPSR